MIGPDLYRRALVVLPGSFRRRYGDDMASMFASAWRDASAPGRARLALRGARDLAVSAVALRLRRSPVSGHRPTAPSAAGWGLGRDVRQAVRGLRRRPGFALVAAGTVALGVGASTAVFSVVDAVVFRALPYPAPDRLVALGTAFRAMGESTFGLSDAEYLDLLDEDTGLAGLGAYALSGATWLPDGGDPARLAVARVYPELAPVLGARAALGRIPAPGDARPGDPPVLLLTHAAWRSRFGGDPGVVGRTVRLDGDALPVVGVLAPGVRLPGGEAEVWAVVTRDRAGITDRSGHYLSGVGRLADGATLDNVRAGLDRVEARWHERFAGQHSPGHPGHAFTAAGLADVTVGGARRIGIVLAVGAGLLLLLACANVAGLLVARGEERAGELGVRAALGAGRGRLARQLLVESLLLALVGGVGGYVLAAWGTTAVLALDPGSLPGLARVRPDGRTLAFALAASLATGLLFGLLPALRLPLGTATPRRASPGASPAGHRLLGRLVVGQVALATAIVVAAGLLARSRAALTAVDPGFHPGGALVFDLGIPADRYPDLASIDAFWSGLQDRLAAEPGVRDVAVVRNLPLRSEERREYILPDPPPADGATDPWPVAVQAVRPGYFDVLAIPLRAGRAILASDRGEAPRVAVVSESAARAFWPGGAVGARFRATFDVREADAFTVVGVVADVRHQDLAEPPIPTVYLPIAQAPVRSPGWVRRATVVMLGSGEAGALASLARRVVRELEPTVPVEGVAPLADVVGGATARLRFLSLLLGVFAVLALGVAAVGVYGTVAFAVARRRREFGVRLALGAEPGDLLRRVLGSGMGMAAAGTVLGLGAALVAGPVLSTVLFGTSPRDAVALTAGPAVLVAVVLAACWIPARRAGRVAPSESLRAGS